MAILMSLYNVWCDKILNGEKPLEFRNNIGKDFAKGTKIYLYESGKNHGRKKVVGEVTIKDIKEIPFEKMGFYNFLGYYVENILKDEALLTRVKEIYDYDLPNYTHGYKFYFLYCPEVLDKLKMENKLPDLLSMSTKDANKQLKAEEKSQQLISDCDAWLSSIGYYNYNGESYYKNYIEIENPIRYKEPLDLSMFKGMDNKSITHAPQSWRYVQDL